VRLVSAFSTPTNGIAMDVETLKSSLVASLDGLDRGLFGVKSEKKQELLQQVEALEASAPCTNPVEQLDLVAGNWRLLFSTVSITGAKRTKLGLREFIKIKDLFQTIDIQDHTATNEVRFAVTGLGTFQGALTIKASFTSVSANRVLVKFEEATLQPAQLQAVFEKNFDMLLSVFNPDGWLDITFVDETMRIGRDDKGNVFILEKCSSIPSLK
jgi:PAP_fibrillin